MIGKPRGAAGTYPVFVYCPMLKRKRYVGSRPTLHEAEQFDAEAKASVKPCAVCRKKYLPYRDHEFRCSDTCIAVKRVKNRSRKVNPPTHWVYTCRDEDGGALYVGISSGGFRRQKEHGYEASWWGHVRNIEVEHHPTRDSALEREKELVRALDPAYNVLLKVAA